MAPVESRTGLMVIASEYSVPSFRRLTSRIGSLFNGTRQIDSFCFGPAICGGHTRLPSQDVISSQGRHQSERPGRNRVRGPERSPWEDELFRDSA